MTKKVRNIIILVVVVVIILIGGGIGVKKYVDNQYKTKMNTAVLAMLNGATEAETVCNVMKSAWYTTIYQGFYIINGTTCYNFDDTIIAEKKLFESNGKYENIRKSKNTVEAIIGKMGNASSSNQRQYDDMMKIYSNYTKFVNMALNPSGSLTSFSADFKTIDSDINADINSYNMRYKKNSVANNN